MATLSLNKKPPSSRTGISFCGFNWEIQRQNESKNGFRQLIVILSKKSNRLERDVHFKILIGEMFANVEIHIDQFEWNVQCL